MTQRGRWLKASDPLDCDQWRKLLSRFPNEARDIYFFPEYVALYEEDGAKGTCFSYEVGEAVFLYPFLIQPIAKHPGKFDITTPYGYGGPISNSTDASFVQAAFAAFSYEALQRGIVAELIKFHPLLGNHRLAEFGFEGHVQDISRTVYVDIEQDETHRWEKIYTHSNRKNIQKSRRAGITVRFGHEPSAWNAYRQLYSETMQKNQAQASYYFSEEYYHAIRTTLPANHILAYAILDGRIVSVLLLLLGSEDAHCHLIGTDREVMSLGVNNLVHHQVISWCKDNDYKRLHIGGGRSPSPDDSLYRFKANFSDISVPFHVGERILDQPLYRRLCDEWTDLNPEKELSHRLLKYRY
ncbi:MAG: hypothetical protein JWM41_3918 [Gemmatimonadetes bacterium]|nr:hypothetical protein [Gemmatimonadota bacterium]